MRFITAPFLNANKYKYSDPGPYRQLSKSALTVAFRLSTTGMTVLALVGVSVGGSGVGVDVSVGCRGAAVEEGAVVDAGADSFVELGAGGAVVVTGAQAVNKTSRLINNGTIFLSKGIYALLHSMNLISSMSLIGSRVNLSLRPSRL